jgi:glycosyltransferase involved in cell wall biosynthesis
MPEKGWEEQFGFSMVEAQAAGLPVIATKIGSINEVVKDQETGLLIEPNSQVALEQAMERLINNKELRLAMGRSGRQYVIDNFSYQKIAKKMSEFFKKVKNNE